MSELRLARVEEKVGEIREQLAVQNILLAEQGKQLALHMRRSDSLEKLVLKEIRPTRILLRILTILSLIATVAMALKAN